MAANGTEHSKVAIVTGAGSGIGAATAKRLARDGYRVVLVGRTREKLDNVVSEYGQADPFLVQVCDVSSAKDVEALMAATLDSFGRLDVLVNNAGVAKPGQIVDFDQQDWEQQMAINAGGPFLTCRAAIPHLRESKGSVVNVSSVSGLGGDWGMFAYNATKGAVSNLTRALALDLGKDGVRVNAVAPSATRTDMASGLLQNEELRAKFVERIPMGRVGDPEDVADVIAFLASDDARFVNGVVLPVDGGLSASNGQPPLG